MHVLQYHRERLGLSYSVDDIMKRLLDLDLNFVYEFCLYIDFRYSCIIFCIIIAIANNYVHICVFSYVATMSLVGRINETLTLTFFMVVILRVCVSVNGYQQ